MDDTEILQRIEEAILGFQISDFVKWYNFDEKQLQSIVSDLESQEIVIKEVLEGHEDEENLIVYTHKRWYYCNRCQHCDLLIATDDYYVCEGPRTPTLVD